MMVYLQEKSSPKQLMKHLLAALNLIQKATSKHFSLGIWVKPTSIKVTWEQPPLIGQDSQGFPLLERSLLVLLQAQPYEQEFTQQCQDLLMWLWLAVLRK